MWTKFWDMYSGGDLKEQWHYIFIEAREADAVKVFYSRFKHNPRRVSCTCCGQDYAIHEEETLEEITGFHRNCAYGEDGAILEEVNTDWGGRGPYIPLETFIQQPDVLVIRADEIGDAERKAAVAPEPSVWMD